MTLRLVACSSVFCILFVLCGIGLFYLGLQKSINGIEKYMDFQCATMRELQAVIVSQHETMLGVEASLHALKPSRPSGLKLNCPDADFSDFRIENPATWPNHKRNFTSWREVTKDPTNKNAMMSWYVLMCLFLNRDCFEVGRAEPSAQLSDVLLGKLWRVNMVL